MFWRMAADSRAVFSSSRLRASSSFRMSLLVRAISSSSDSSVDSFLPSSPIFSRSVLHLSVDVGQALFELGDVLLGERGHGKKRDGERAGRGGTPDRSGNVPTRDPSRAGRIRASGQLGRGTSVLITSG